MSGEKHFIHKSGTALRTKWPFARSSPRLLIAAAAIMFAGACAGASQTQNAPSHAAGSQTAQPPAKDMPIQPAPALPKLPIAEYELVKSPEGAAQGSRSKGLTVKVPVLGDASQTFAATARLESLDGKVIAYRREWNSAAVLNTTIKFSGPHEIVPFTLSGEEIRRSGVDGPYVLVVGLQRQLANERPTTSSPAPAPVESRYMVNAPPRDRFGELPARLISLAMSEQPAGHVTLTARVEVDLAATYALSFAAAASRAGQEPATEDLEWRGELALGFHDIEVAFDVRQSALAKVIKPGEAKMMSQVWAALGDDTGGWTDTKTLEVSKQESSKELPKKGP